MRDPKGAIAEVGDKVCIRDPHWSPWFKLPWQYLLGQIGYIEKINHSAMTNSPYRRERGHRLGARRYSIRIGEEVYGPWPAAAIEKMEESCAERLAVIEAGARQSLIDCLDPNEGAWTCHHRTLAVSRADRYAAAKAANSQAKLLAALKECLEQLSHKGLDRVPAAIHAREAIEETERES
jgi:hypothetical protein